MSTTNINFKIGVIGDHPAKPVRKYKPPVNKRGVSLDGITRLVKARGLEPHIEAKVLSKAKKYPHGALSQFKKNLGRIIRETQKGK